MKSANVQPKSGHFVLRMPAALHSALDTAARTSGTSLNTFCVRHLATAGLGVFGNADVTSLLVRAHEIVGDALSAIVLHGSWVRGEATPASDVDALIVVDRQVTLNRSLYRAWDEAPAITWRGVPLDPHFVNLPKDSEFSGLWAEVALDGIVVLDGERRVSAHLSCVRRAIAAGRLVRRVVHGHPYWKVVHPESKNPTLAADPLNRASARLQAIDVLFEAGSWADVVREAQEVVELALKGLLHAAGVDPPRLHDVGDVLNSEQSRLPAGIRSDVDELAEISRTLRRDRELAFYGAEDVTPGDFFRAEDADRARSGARLVVDRVRLHVLPKSSG